MPAEDRSSSARGPRSPHAPRGEGLVLPESAARVLAVAAVAGIALIHVLDAPDTFTSTRYVFWLYMALVAAGVPLITLLLHWPSSRVWLLAIGFAAGPLIGYVASRTAGLPGDAEDVGNWLDSLGLASLFVEASLIALGLARLCVHHRVNRHAYELALSDRAPRARSVFRPRSPAPDTSNSSAA